MKKKKDKDLPAGVRRKADLFHVSVSLPGVGGSRTIAKFASKEAAIEALGYASAKVQEIKDELGGQKLASKDEKDAKLGEVKRHVTESISKKIFDDATFAPSPSTIVIEKAMMYKPDVMGVDPTCIRDTVPQDYRSPSKSTPPTLSTRLPVKKRPNHQVVQDMSVEEDLEQANEGLPKADYCTSNKPKADEKTLPLKKRRLIVHEFTEIPKSEQQQDQQRNWQKQDGHIQSAEKEGSKVNNIKRPSPQMSTCTMSSRASGTSPSHVVIADQAAKLRSTLNGLINDGVLEWRPSGLSFIIKKTEYLRAIDFATLSAWGFDQIRAGEDLGALIHPNYRRDQPTLSLMPTRRSAKTNYCLSIVQERYSTGTFLDVVIPRRSVSNPSSSFGIDLTYDADGWTRLYTRTGQHGWLRDGDVITAINGEKMFLTNSLMFNPSHQQKPMIHALVVMACRRTPPGMPLTLRLFRENKSARSTSI